MKSRVHLVLISILLLCTAPGFAAGEPREAAAATAPQPLTYTNIVRHFKNAGFRATEVQKRCTVFFEGEWTGANRYNYCLIIAENSDEDVQITFYLTDAHEMNWITEFLDAPFFTKAETQKLFTLLNTHAPREAGPVGRYRVEFHHWEPKHAQIFVFSFTPTSPRR